MAIIPMEQFVDFALVPGLVKVKIGIECKESMSDAGSMRYDFYRPLREAIVEMHKTGKPASVLDYFLAAQHDDRRRRIYPPVVKGYRRFIEEQTEKVTWFAPPTRTCLIGDAHGGVNVDVKPDLGLVIDGRRHLIAMYFRGEPLSANRILMTSHLLAIANDDDFWTPAFSVLDVRNAKLHTLKVSNPRMCLVLRGEAASFARIYQGL